MFGGQGRRCERPSSASSRSTAASTDPFCSFDHTTTVVNERTERGGEVSGERSPLHAGAGRSPSSWTWIHLELAEQQHGLITSARPVRSGSASRPSIAGHPVPSGTASDEVLRRRGSAELGPARPAAVLDAGPGAFCRSPAVRRGGGSRVRPGSVLGIVRVSRTSRPSGTGAEIRTVRSLPERWTTTLDAVPIVRPELLALHLFAHGEPYARAERWVRAPLGDAAPAGPVACAMLCDFWRLRAQRDRLGPSLLDDCSGLRPGPPP